MPFRFCKYAVFACGYPDCYAYNPNTDPLDDSSDTASSDLYISSHNRDWYDLGCACGVFSGHYTFVHSFLNCRYVFYADFLSDQHTAADRKIFHEI
jgi:hypothetical protein